MKTGHGYFAAQHDRPTFYFYLSLVAKQPQAINRRRRGRDTSARMPPFLPFLFPSHPRRTKQLASSSFFRLPSSLLPPRNNHVYSAINSTSLRPNNSVHQPAPSPPAALTRTSFNSLLALEGNSTPTEHLKQSESSNAAVPHSEGGRDARFPHRFFLPSRISIQSPARLHSPLPPSVRLMHLSPLLPSSPSCTAPPSLVLRQLERTHHRRPRRAGR